MADLSHHMDQIRKILMVSFSYKVHNAKNRLTPRVMATSIRHILLMWLGYDTFIRLYLQTCLFYFYTYTVLFYLSYGFSNF